MNFKKLLIGMFLFAAMTGCAPRQETIDGSIFIVTKGGDNVKLGLVTVSIFNEQQIATYLAKTTADLKNHLEELETEEANLNTEKARLTEKYNQAASINDERREKWQSARDLAEETAQKFDSDYLAEIIKPQATRPVFQKSDEDELGKLQNKETEHEKLDQKYQNMPFMPQPSEETAGKIMSLGDVSDLNQMREILHEPNSKWSDPETLKRWYDYLDILFKQEDEQKKKEQAELTKAEQEAKDAELSSEEMSRLHELSDNRQKIEDEQSLWDEWRPIYLKQIEDENRLQRDLDKASNELKQYANLLAKTQQRIDFVDRQMQSWANEKPQDYSKSLPIPFAFSKSDADGKFSLVVPQQLQFILLAQAQRQVLDKTEKYYWLVRVHPDSKSEMQIMLSNDNLITANSPDSAVRLPVP